MLSALVPSILFSSQGNMTVVFVVTTICERKKDSIDDQWLSPRILWMLSKGEIDLGYGTSHDG